MREILETDEFSGWFEELDSLERKAVAKVIEVLSVKWLATPEPYAKALDGSRYALRELRPNRGQSPLRIFYAFDPNRDAVILLGGDKAAEAKFYERNIPRAERLWEKHLAELEAKDSEGGS